MKEKAIFVWIDNCKSKRYKRVKNLISKKYPFSLLKNVQTFCRSFDKLADDECCLDLSINWVTESHKIMFAAWIKHVFTKADDVEASK